MKRQGLLGLIALCWCASTARADVPLRIDRSAERMRVDGALREWKGARFNQIGEDAGASVRYALASADGGIYVGAEVSDDQLTRKRGIEGDQDALVLILAMPGKGDAWQTTEVWLFPGEPGRTKAEAATSVGRGARRAEARVQLVEGPREQGAAGYVIEAFVPWSLVQGAEIWEQGRGALRFEDADGSASSVVASARSAAASGLPRLVLGVGHNDFLGSFLASQNLTGIEPRFDLRGDVYGDGTAERVVLVDRFVLAYGPGYKRGESYGYMALPIGMGGGLKEAQLVDLTADGRAELVVRLRQRNDLGARELWTVVSLAEENPRQLFAIEVRKEAAGGFVENALSVTRAGRGAPRIQLKPARAQGVDASTFREAPASDAQPILLPWGEVESRVYGFDGSAFALVEERAKPGATKPVSRAEPAAASAPVIEEPVVVPSVGAVLALFKQQQKLPAGLAPRRKLEGNFAGGPAPEQLFELGTSLVLVGPEIGDGASYLAYTLPISSSADCVYLGSADITGDGVREIFARVKQPLSGAEGVHREVVLVLRSDAQGRLGRALAAEVTRRQGDHVVANRVRTRGGSLVIEPGTAEGWEAASYPFTSEATGGVERLLLPWSDAEQAYRLEGARFVPVER